MEEALLVSLKLAFVTTAALLSLSLILSYLLVFVEFPLKGLVEALLLMPIVLPPTVLGFYILLLLGHGSLVGELLQAFLGKPLLFSFEGLVLASVIYSLPFGVFPVRDAFQDIPKRYLEIAYVFGYSKFETLVKVVLPNSLGGVLTACALVFAHTMGEFGVVLMVGGNIPGETRTLSIYIYDEVQALNYEEAHRASLLLLTVSLLALSIILVVRKKWVKV